MYFDWRIGLALAVAAAIVGLIFLLRSNSLAPAALERKYAKNDRFILVSGARVRVREEGPEGAPPVILLHGFTYSLESWDAWAATLSGRYRVIRYDLLGHGLTGPDPKKRYAPAARAAFIGEVMDALGIRSAYLAGNSLGGLAAWRFAAHNPDRVKGLLLVSPGAYSFNGVTDEPVEPPAAMKLYLRRPTAAGVKASAQIVYADPAKITEARLRVLRDMMRRRGNGEAFVESIRQFVLPDPTAELARIAAPTLIQWGAMDRLIPAEQGARVQKAIPNARLIVYDGVGHAAQEEDPERTARDALDFLNSLERESN